MLCLLFQTKILQPHSNTNPKVPGSQKGGSRLYRCMGSGNHRQREPRTVGTSLHFPADASVVKGRPFLCPGCTVASTSLGNRSAPAAVPPQPLGLLGLSTPGGENKTETPNDRKILWFYKCQTMVAPRESERKKWLIAKQTASIFVQITVAQLCT